MNIYFTEVFRLVHHFTCIYTSSWISHTSDSHKSFNIDIYISFVLPAVRASFIQGLYFWFRVFKVIIPVYQYITKFFLRFSTLATGTLRSWSVRHQFDACASRWCPTDANPSVPMVTQAKIIDNSHLQFSSNSHAIIDEIFRNAPAILTYNSHPILTRQFSSNSHLQFSSNSHLQFSSNSHLTILIQFSPDNSHPIFTWQFSSNSHSILINTAQSILTNNAQPIFS